MATTMCATGIETLSSWTPDVLRTVSQGRIVLVKQALQTFDLLESFHKTTVAGIASVCGQPVAARVSHDGFDRLHEAVPLEAMAPLVHTLTGWFSRFSRPFVSRLCSPSGVGSTLFVPDRAWPRLMVPYDLVASSGADFSKYLGHLVSHNPHRDSWFSQPLNGINGWIAIGPVLKGNGLLIYPDVFGKTLPREHTDVARAEPLGVPITQPMDPGDLLLFHGDHLHSSELNVTDRTRYVVSFRLCVDPPMYPDGQKQTKYAQVQAPTSR